jgi:3D (Asp-Asp-Asp) domain-containing protein
VKEVSTVRKTGLSLRRLAPALLLLATTALVPAARWAPAVPSHLTAVATAYGPSARDNYPYGPTNFFGMPLQAGDVAVDPSVIPFGTRLWISGYHTPLLPAGGFEAVANDTGGAIQGNRIDIYLPDGPAQVASFGRQVVHVTVLGG